MSPTHHGGGDSWTVLTGADHYDTCSLFHQGRFLGTATAKAYGFTLTINRFDASSIQVAYHWLKSGVVAANPTGKTYASFTGNTTQHKVVMKGHVPPVQS